MYFMAMISLSILFLFSLSTFLAMWSFLPFISWLIIDSGAPWNKKEYQRQSAQLSNKSMMKIPNYVNTKCCVFIIKNKIWLTKYYYRSFYSISKVCLSSVGSLVMVSSMFFQKYNSKTKSLIPKHIVHKIFFKYVQISKLIW